ncbi:amino acid ABC transporter substrate-binding protein (PAAT family) [Leucobacter komagatae]|uniref:Amino acid ABC transporter substrate-binding protein (PAAT family) n=1 Tax=Leucobacter komagatae TaxID=55969 RepID=A0A542Y866_9MICO|nr:ABC transporter substrate-binding protein [Leucobacter komagatae]TQL44251.1 amino acid ABC transporter substrate-binding protein (PAAT family) [Leucobacter komagatae]
MKNRKLLSAIGALAVATLALAGCASEGSGAGEDAAGNELNLITPGELRVGMDTVSKPFAYAEGDNFKGFDVELMTHMAESLDLKPEFVGMEFASLLPNVVNGQLDTVSSAVSINEERKKTVDFSEGYFIAYYTVMTTPGTGITDQASLSGKKVGVLQGTFQDKWATENFDGAEIVRFTDHNLTFAALKNGTIDAQFFDLAVANDYIAQNPDMKLELAFDVPAEDSPHGFPVKKGNDALREALNKALAEAIADGTYKELFEQYFPGQPLAEKFQP